MVLLPGDVRVVPRDATIARDGNGNITSVTVGGQLKTIARDGSGAILSVTSNGIITTILRDGSGNITGLTVADV